MDELKVTPAAEWREPREQGIPIKLPSGNIVRFRPCPLGTLLKEIGDCPPFIAKAISDALNGSGVGLFPAPVNHLELMEQANFGLTVARLCFVSPRITDDPQNDGEISPSDLGVDDMVFCSHLFDKNAAFLRSLSEPPDVPPVPPEPTQGGEGT